jgi:hypothetical protein
MIDKAAGLSVTEYYKHFWSLFGALTTILGISPLSALVDPHYHIFPPMGGGSLEKLLVAVSLGASIATSLFVYVTRNIFTTGALGRRIGALMVVGLAGIVSLGFYIKWHVEFVRDVRIPARKQVITVSVGAHRRGDDPKEYAKMSDEEMLRDGGVTEDSVRRLFTMESITKARVWLYLSYLITMIMFVAFGSFVVLFSALDESKYREGNGRS